jgi:hypothetical protein
MIVVLIARYLQRNQIDTFSEKVQFFSLCFYLTLAISSRKIVELG